MANLLVFAVLVVALIPHEKNFIRTFIKSNTARDNKWGTNAISTLVMSSVFFFWLAAESFLGSTFMADAHVIDGVNIWETVGYQFVGGGILAIAGSSTLATGLVLHYIRRPALIGSL